MFCDACGSALQPGQGFCANCGKQITAVPARAAVSYPTANRVRGHIRFVGILWLAFSALELVGSAILFIIANTIFLHHVDDFSGPRPAFLHLLLSFVAIVLAVKAAAGILAGWGLLQRESWARVLTLVLAFLALIHIPFGTALGVYTLWVLLPAHSEREYEEQARTAA